MTRKTTSAKTRMIDAVGELLRIQPAEQITVRQIAAKASVNIAAINYHFQSKENLISQAIEMIRDQSFAEFLAGLHDHSLGPATRIKRFLQAYATLCVVHPNIATYNYKRMIDAAGHKTSAQLDTILTQLVQVLREIWDTEDNKKLNYAALQLFSAVMLPFLVKGQLNRNAFVDWQQYTERSNYISALVDLFVKTHSG